MIPWFARRAAPLAAIALGVALSGCAYMSDHSEVSGVPLAELDLSGEAPDIIGLAGPDKVVISEGDTFEVTLDGDADAGAALRFDRDGNELTIARDTEIYDGPRSAIIRITMPAPSGLEIAGTGKIEAETMASDAQVEIAGAGAVTIGKLSANRLGVEIAGSGAVTAAGTAKVLSVEIAGSGDVRLANLTADDVTVEIAGSGNVNLASNGSVTADIAGSGDVVVVGSATCSLNSAGSGSLTCRPAAQADSASVEDTVAE
jgi:hypothetical protein